MRTHATRMRQLRLRILDPLPTESAVYYALRWGETDRFPSLGAMPEMVVNASIDLKEQWWR